MTYNVKSVRSHFPQLVDGAAHFDGPGGSQTPDVVADAIRAALVSPLSNRGQTTQAERNSESIVGGARRAMADLLNAPSEAIVFGRSMTQLTYDFSRTLAKNWGPGDEVVVTRLDHDANIRPWVQAAESVGATVRWVDFDRTTAELTAADVANALSSRTVLAAVTGASNLLGTRPDLGEIVSAIHQAGALAYIDGVHLTPHASVDVAAIDADFFGCSPYKFLGPHCGAIAGKPEVLEGLAPDKLLPSTAVVPERFEFGTLPYELLAGTEAAVDFLADLDPGAAVGRREKLVSSMSSLEAYEDELRVVLESRLAELPGIKLYGHASQRTPTLLFSLDGKESASVYEHLGSVGVNAPAGSFYALEASRWIGLGDTGAVRVGLAPYTDEGDLDRLLEGLKTFAA
ncbi:MAG: cysteine desulfurase-like protein [Actinomycetota bacterium]|nr:cysteine desulfurase-like protein [Actinomycetota bacterium]